MELSRKANQDEMFTSMEKHPRCALLPSPEKLNESIGSPGSDKTDTIRDFNLVKGWVTESELLNTDFFRSGTGAASGAEVGNLEDSEYYSFIRLAFSTAFDAMRNTKRPALEELVFWYYAGHGLGKEAARKLSYSSTPNLTDRVSSNYHEAANGFVTEGRKVKGGELCLHKVGFCDIYGLLKPWIAAVKAESINATECSKKNKHLVIILDSCHSGIIAQELKDFEKETKGKDPTFLKENSVTIQAACGPDQRTFGGYFTPCFVLLNDPKNSGLLSELKDEWSGMTEEKKNEYEALELPSPMVVTTRPQFHDVTMELTIQEFNLTLFRNPGFFKFCSIKVYRQQDKSLFERVLVPNLVTAFMNHRPFNVLDYKLKTLVTGQYTRTPMGLFLLEDHQNAGYAVCAHIHFQLGNTKKYQRINLVHHKKPPVGSVLYLEDHGGLSSVAISQNKHKIQVPLDGNAQDLVQACHDFVESQKLGRWNDVSQWNMTGLKPGVNGLFRVQERSAWEDSYLEYIKDFNLPKVANN